METSKFKVNYYFWWGTRPLIRDGKPYPYIPPHRREIPMNCGRYFISYDVEKAKVSRTTLSPIYRYSTCGGHRMSNHLSHFAMCNNPHETIQRSQDGYID